MVKVLLVKYLQSLQKASWELRLLLLFFCYFQYDREQFLLKLFLWLPNLCRDKAIVIANEYTDITSPYNPKASVPIFCDIYELKNIVIERKIKDVIVKINPFIRNFFSLGILNFAILSVYN